MHEGLVNSTFGTEVFSGRGFLVSLFSGESEAPEKVQQALLSEISRVGKEGIDRGDFLSCKNAIYGRMLRTLYDVEDSATALLGAEMSGLGLLETVNLLADITPEAVEARLKSDFDPCCMALAVVHPRK